MAWIFFFVMHTLALGAASFDQERCDDLFRIEEQLVILNDVKERYKASIESNQIDALRWQFQNNVKLEARWAYRIIAVEQQRVDEIDERIDALENRKQEIICALCGAQPVDQQ